MVSREELEKLFSNKTIAVTGGIGSIGSEIVSMLLGYNIKKLIIIDNRETEMFYKKSLFNTNNSNQKLEFKLGDVRNFRRINELLKSVDIVFHAAAMKHVIMSEENPYEAINTNILGTRNVIDAVIGNNVEKMILISTDKAANPGNVMGTTKLLAEKLVSAIANSDMRRNSKFGIVRFGNVLYSRGSVLEIWDNQIKSNNNLTLTNPDMTRFFMSIPQSVNLIFSATYYSEFGETFIFKMPSVIMKDFFDSYCNLKNIPESKRIVIGTRLGEKLHEELLNKGEKEYLYENEKMFVRVSSFSTQSQVDKLISKGFSKSSKESFESSSSENILSKDEILKVLLNF